jgi:hypothetical protein
LAADARHPTTGHVLKQNQATGQAAIVSTILAFRRQHSSSSRTLSSGLRVDQDWSAMVTRVEETLADWPIPRLQRPFAPFLYTFGWSWRDDGAWSLREYRAGDRSITLFPGVGEALTSLGPLLRPFTTRWWTDKAAQLNPKVEAARSVLEFEEFLFGRDRVALERVAEGLVDLQNGACFYCHASVGRRREIDHFIPWSHSGDDGLDNLVAACHTCNNSKRANLPAPEHLAELLRRNHAWDSDLEALASERRWPRDHPRSHRIARAAYLRSPDELPLWIYSNAGSLFETLASHRHELAELLP